MKHLGLVAMVLGIGLTWGVGEALAGQKVILYDNFDDGNIDGWSAAGFHGGTLPTPVVVASPEGFSLRGVGSGYSSPFADNLLHSVHFGGPELTIEMRARAGAEWPNVAGIMVYSGSDYATSSYYEGMDQGESEHMAHWVRVEGPEWNVVSRTMFPIGEMAHAWHDFKWARAADGGWSFYIDGSLQSGNYRLDAAMTSFDGIALNLCRDQSEIEWIRVSATPRPVITYNVVTGSLTMDADVAALNGFIIHSTRGDFNENASLPPDFAFGDNTSTLITSQLLPPGGSPFSGTWSFGDHIANQRSGHLWNAAQGRWDLDNWTFQYTIDGAAGIYDGQIKITGPLPGDVDLDGDVDAWDIQHILACNSYNRGTGWAWAQGDFNGDGQVNWQDIQMILDHGQYGQELAGPLAAMVPEPATLALLALGGVGLLRRRRA